MAALLQLLDELHLSDLAVREGGCWLLLDDVACVRAGAPVRLRRAALRRCAENLGEAASAEAAALSATVQARAPDGWLRLTPWRDRAQARGTAG